MIFHVSVCLLAHEEKGLISNTFLTHKTGVQLFGSSDWLYSRFFYLFSSLSGFSVSATLSIMSTTTALSCAADIVVTPLV